MIHIKKRNGDIVGWEPMKIKNAIHKAFGSSGEKFGLVLSKKLDRELENFEAKEEVSKVSTLLYTVEDVQDFVENFLIKNNCYKTAKEYILYRYKHSNARLVRERLDYMQKYNDSTVNAATASEVDPNSNVNSKNVANLEGEVYKSLNIEVHRQRMKDALNCLYPEVAKQYIKDLEDHIIYAHDENQTPTLKPYCMAVTLYPLMLDGVGNVDGVTPTAPNDIASFSGQVTNLVFLLSSQVRGAVALGDYFITLNYYVVKEFGNDWHEHIDYDIMRYQKDDGTVVEHTVGYFIRKGMKQFIYGINQPAGNRSYNSPFTNVSYYDRHYFSALFDDYYYPDGTKPKWEQIDKLQRMFCELHRELRLIKPLTFPVSTTALLYNQFGFLDPETSEWCADEWAKGSSHFCYINNNPTALASCCRVQNEISDNTFSSTTGMTGVMTGSANVITLNINRIVQNWFKDINKNVVKTDGDRYDYLLCNISVFMRYFRGILDRVYKYQIAFKGMLYDMEEDKMFASCNANYISISKLYCTIGVIGYFEAAKLLGLNPDYNKDYIGFLQFIFSTISEENKKHSIKGGKRPYIFNLEAVPGEGLGIKLYNWDKADGYEVPEDQNLYNCYFYNPWNNTDVFDKMRLHGSDVAPYLNGGQACHINLDDHLGKRQYQLLLDFARKNGVNYFTFNIPMSECRDCGHTVNAPIKECPKCQSKSIRYWTRIIGYLTAVDNWSKPRQDEFEKRFYSKGIGSEG